MNKIPDTTGIWMRCDQERHSDSFEVYLFRGRLCAWVDDVDWQNIDAGPAWLNDGDASHVMVECLMGEYVRISDSQGLENGK